VLAAARHVVGLERQLERPELGFLAQLLRGDLIHRDAVLEIGTFGLLRVRTRQVPRR